MAGFIVALLAAIFYGIGAVHEFYEEGGSVSFLLFVLVTLFFLCGAALLFWFITFPYGHAQGWW